MILFSVQKLAHSFAMLFNPFKIDDRIISRSAYKMRIRKLMKNIKKEKQNEQL